MAQRDDIEVLTAAKLWPPMMEALHGAFRVHDRIHQSDAAAFAAAAPRIRAIAASGESKIPRELIAQLPKLEIISVFGVGYDGVDVAAARERGVAVTHTPNVLNDEVADLAIALVLAVSRRLIEADRYVRSGQWAKGPMPLARKVSGARMGIVGLGRIGLAIAKRAEAFGMTVAYTSRNAAPRFALPLLQERGGAGGRGRFPGRHHARRRRHAQAHRRRGAGRARQEGLPRQRRARLGGRRAGAGRGAARTAPSPAPASTSSRTSRTCRASCSRSTTSSSRRTSAAPPGRRARRWPTWPSATSQAHFAGRPLLSPVPADMRARPAFDLIGQLALDHRRRLRASAWRSRAAWPRPGARVVLNGRGRAKLEAAAARCAAKACTPRPPRSTSPIADAVRAGVAEVAARVGAVDILVNNAGIQHRAPIAEFSDADWRRLMATNLDAPFYMARAVIPAMQARRAGKIINIGSLMSSLARPTTVPYQASKGGIAMLTRGLAVELAPHDIQVNAIAPGFFRTEMNTALTDNAEFSAWVEQAHAGRPLGRAAGARRRRRLPRLAGGALRHRPGPLRRRRLHRRHVAGRRAGAQSCPSVSASSWKRPSLWTSQISMKLHRPGDAARCAAAGRRAGSSPPPRRSRRAHATGRGSP